MLIDTSVEVGKTYQFNNAEATVTRVTDGEVVWHEIDGIIRRTPRWFFEKHISREISRLI